MTILLILAIIIGIVAANKQKEIKEKQTGPGIRCTNAWMKKVCFRADRLRHSEALHGKEE